MNALQIKENRKRLKLTQDGLGKLLGVSKRTIINYENGEVIPESKSELLRQILLGTKVENKEQGNPAIDSIAVELGKSKVFQDVVLEIIRNEFPQKENDPKNRAVIEKLLKEVEKDKLVK